MGAENQSKSGRKRGPAGGRRKPASSGSKSAASAPRNPAMELHPTTDVPDIERFDEWDLAPDVLQAIADMGITSPTPVQRLAIGPVLKRRDIIAKAETGTGKTLAFGAGMISKLDADRATVLGLVLCPTRELASQVNDVLALLGKARGIRTALIVGGDPPQPQVKALQDGAQLVVGTPGRVMDLYNQGFLSFPWTEFVVLDEADEMLEIGFIDDIKKILSYTPDERTTLLFSATFPPALLKLAREYTNNPLEIATAKGVATIDNISQHFIKASDEDKWLTLVRLIENSDKEDVFLIFGDRRTDVDQLIRSFERLPFNVKALHGGYDQAARFRVMTAFRTGDVKCLVATDVASRGLDVKHVSHVINFGVPRDVSIYTHRIGRTGRAGAKGAAITLVSPKDMRRWHEVSGAMNWEVEEMPMPDRGGSRRGYSTPKNRPPRSQAAPAQANETVAEPKRERSSSKRPSPAAKVDNRSEDQPRERVRTRSRSAASNGESNRESNRESSGASKPRTTSAPSRGDGPVETPGKGKRIRISSRRQQAAQAEAAPAAQPESKPRETPREPKAETHNQAAAPGGFGAGVKPEANGAPKRKRSKPAADKPKPRAASADKPAQDKPRPNSAGGFGAGI